MQQFFVMIGNLWGSIVDLLDGVPFSLFGYTVSLWQVLLAFLVMSLIITVFWQGAKG